MTLRVLDMCRVLHAARAACEGARPAAPERGVPSLTRMTGS